MEVIGCPTTIFRTITGRISSASWNGCRLLTGFIFQQLGDPSRLRILWLLCHSEECVCNIAAAVGMSDPAVSHHLRILKKGGIIESRRDGKEVYYTLADTTQAKLLHRTIDALFEITCPTD